MSESNGKTHDHDATRAKFVDAAKGKLTAEQDEAFVEELFGTEDKDGCPECEKAWEEHLSADKTQSSLSGLNRKANTTSKRPFGGAPTAVSSGEERLATAFRSSSSHSSRSLSPSVSMF
jgi:hypothetical protein